MVTFEWDENKNRINQEKHNISFEKAQMGFADANRIIAKDFEHSGTEERFYCFKRIGNNYMTIRFTFIDNKIRIFGAGVGNRETMQKRLKYTYERTGRLEVFEDFLPEPDKLVFK